MLVSVCSVFFFKQKTAYEMRISDWSSDVCSSDLTVMAAAHAARPKAKLRNVTRVMVLPLLLECCSQFGQFPRGQRFAGAHPVDDQPVMFGPAVLDEIENVLAERIAERQVGIDEDHLVVLALGLGDDLAGRRDDGRATEHLETVPRAAFGRRRAPRSEEHQ